LLDVKKIKAEIWNKCRAGPVLRFLSEIDLPAEFAHLENVAICPAFNTLRMDDQSRLWVSVITDDSDTYDWWVLNEDGSKQAHFTWPRDRNIQLIRDGYVYTREEDEMGLVQIIRYGMSEL
jgi:hypothetical protein